ncbi:MAG: hypothetical protein WDZ90_01650 [Candidatus Paceibacterota bacterium]
MKKERKEILLLLAVLIYGIFALHLLATLFYFYWTLWWYDIMMHGLGGFFVGLSTLWFFYLSGYVQAPRNSLIFFYGIVSALVVGVLWEVFEYIVGATNRDEYMFDTFLDLLMDIAGGLGAYYYFLSKWKEYTHAPR